MVRRQGQIWRGLLTGEKAATDMLQPGHYIAAARRTLLDTRPLLRQAVRAAGPVLTTLAVLAALGLALTIVLGTTDLLRLAGSLAVIGGLAASGWGAVRVPYSSAVERVARPLWRGSLETAVCDAITLPPASRAPG